MYRVQIQSNKINQTIQYDIEDDDIYQEQEQLLQGKIIWKNDKSLGIYLSPEAIILITFTKVVEEKELPPTEDKLVNESALAHQQHLVEE